ncbi:MAG: hypothetical protein ACLRJC_12565 [Emergencia timonensis]|uniref:hypothetical protein n=1 Tax=Emergencia timonensis TaxID=1776384 RepID=UPI0008302340|nr:hypothetical protein [Emergencia timonensis]WNX89732.1 hypothetical protein RVY71_05540 [Emergencia timonensis]
MADKKKQGLILLAVLVAVAVIVSAFIHAGEDDQITDPGRLAGVWQPKEIWQGGKLISEEGNTASLAIDKEGGYRFWNGYGQDQTGRLQEKNGELRFDGKNGGSYVLHGEKKQLIVTAKVGDEEETWICEWTNYYGDTQLTDEERLTALYTIQKKGMDMKDQTCGWFYTAIAGNLFTGMPEGEAVTQAKDKFIEDAAFTWYAKEHDLVVTDKELDKYMDDLISEAKGADNFQVYEKALQNAGLTYENSIRGNADIYRERCIVNKLYEEHFNDWDAFAKDVVNRFKHTNAYRSLKVEMNDAVEQAKEEI